LNVAIDTRMMICTGMRRDADTRATIGAGTHITSRTGTAIDEGTTAPPAGPVPPSGTTTSTSVPAAVSALSLVSAPVTLEVMGGLPPVAALWRVLGGLPPVAALWRVLGGPRIALAGRRDRAAQSGAQQTAREGGSSRSAAMVAAAVVRVVGGEEVGVRVVMKAATCGGVSL